jgi:regulator of RNase E activity RraA
MAHNLVELGKDQAYVTLTNPTGRAAFWGELLSTGCAFKGVVGVLTNGPTRYLSRT